MIRTDERTRAQSPRAFAAQRRAAVAAGIVKTPQHAALVAHQHEFLVTDFEGAERPAAATSLERPTYIQLRYQIRLSSRS